MLRIVPVSDQGKVLPVVLILRVCSRAILRERVFEIVLLQAVERVSFPRHRFELRRYLLVLLLPGEIDALHPGLGRKV